ncbi:MAG: hypothetical protein ABI672_06465 [Vicinamibacteria bacterium]
MTALFIFGLMFAGFVAALVAIPLILLKVVFGITVAVVSIPLQLIGAVLGGVTRVAFKGMFWLALVLIPLALIAFPFTILAFGAWLLYRIVRPRRPAHAYVVS